MEEELKENLVEEETTENAEQPAEEVVEEVNQEQPIQEEEKIYTESDLNKRLDEILAKKIANKEFRIRKEYDKKYKKLEKVLKAGTGEEDIDKIADTFKDFYTKQGIDIPNDPIYDEEEEEFVVEGIANKIINSGYEDIKEEVDRLASIGSDNLQGRDLKLFMKLSKARKEIEEEQELESIGIHKEDLTDDFKKFSKNLNPNMSLKEKYEMYEQYKPKEKNEIIGSMINNQPKTKKDYYTAEEINKLSEEDLEDDEIFEAVRKSMTKNYTSNM